MVELNFGCPHPALMPGVHGGSMIGQDPEVAFSVTQAVCEAVDIPVVVKLTPDQSKPVDIAKAVKEAGAAAVTATNRYTAFAVDIDTAKPRLGGTAGIGGTWTKPLSLRYVHNIYKEVGIPIAGSNGIFDHRDVVEFIMTGANIVEVGSVLMVKGMKWLPNIIRGLERFMDEHGYKDIASMYGIASDAAATDYSDQFAMSRVTAEVNGETCQNPTCNVCVQMCFYEALSQDPAGKINVHNDKCIGCELCMDVCPFDSIQMVPTSEADYADGYFKVKDEIYEPADSKFATKRNNMDTIEADAPKAAAE
jgi:dihydroorotate dehydrogenase (fumarate)/dihydropyrimidine dehydrogenase (NAD+) subunit PreA